MEILGAIISVVECASPHVAKRWEYHRDFEKNRDALREVHEKLSSRMKDIIDELDTKLVPEEIEARSEVSSWLERVKKICQEIEDIEKKVRGVKFLSRAKLGREMSEKKLKVDEVYEEGVFSEGGLIKRLPHRGNVMPTPATMEGETTAKRTEDEIWRCLFDDKVTKIGVHGMGGAGKTTIVKLINNRLLGEKDKFDKVIWVTVSNKFEIKDLQIKLARELKIDLAGVDDEEARAQELRKGFVKSKRYVLILDDLWDIEHDTLEKIGIPNHAPVNGCKLILTTRFLDVCRKVVCDEEIVMNLMSEVEALDLFLAKVGPDVSSNPKLKELVKQVARECARLPLAIVTMAGTLRRKTDPNEWEVALADLKDSTASTSSELIMRNLRLSYDWLKDKKLQDCLLYCALFPEDYPIVKSLLVDQLIANGIVEDTKTIQYQVGKGQVMLTKLISVSLLENSFNDEGAPSIKMHDLIRDMAIQIMCENSQRFMVQAGKELASIPAEKYWNENLEMVTLMGNNIYEISSDTNAPNCPKISTLFLNSNYLVCVPNNFFSHMKGLNVLNLSHTSIIRLPESVSDLVNLAILLLEGCECLVHVPSLANLTNMKRLDLNRSGISEVPTGIEMMVKLTHLNLSMITGLELIPDRTLCKLTNLRFLSFLNREKITLRVDELSNLRKLETIEASLDFKGFKSLLCSFEKENRGHTNMTFVVVPEGRQYDGKITQNILIFDKCEIKCKLPLWLPKNIKVLFMEDCDVLVANLSQLFSLRDEASLVKISMSYCTSIEYLFHYTPSIFHLLQRLEKLYLVNLSDLRGLVSMERAPLPLGAFSSLKKLLLGECPNVKKIFLLGDPSLPNLESIRIEICEELEEISSVENEATTIILPKLRDLILIYLPKLKSIPFEAESLQEIMVIECPMIKEFGLIDREPYPLSLKHVTVDNHTWNSKDGIKWDWNHFSTKFQNERIESDE